ncbi:MAG TPA: protein kinase, partial [Polyangiaceae bacterium]
MSSASSSSNENSQPLGETRVQDVLLDVEQAAMDAQVWFASDAGFGEVLFSHGRIVGARLGGARGKTALLRLLALNDGRYGIKRCTIPSNSAIIRDVAALCDLHRSRQAKWERLCSNAPPLGSVLTLTADGKAARHSSIGIQRVILVSIDGKRTLMQILEQSSFDPIDTLTTITQTIHGDLARVTHAATPQFPLVQTTNASERQPFERCETFTQSNAAMASTLLAPIPPRKATLSGLGVKQSSPILAPAPIITIDDPIEAIRPSPNTQGPRPFSNEPTFEGASPQGAERRRIDHYEILLRIGQGHASTVYLARPSAIQSGLRRLCVLRLVQGHQTADGRRNFLQAAKLAANLHHANIVSVHDAGLHEGQPFVVLDYVESCPLDELITGVARTPSCLILPILIDALAGLEAAHSLQDELGLDRKPLHYEVTPRNILVGTDGTCRLTDFGYASQFQQRLGTIPIAKAEYVAPERIEGNTVDHRADIFSMGVVLWNALTGRRLFSGATTDEVLQNVRTSSIRPPSFAGARIPPALDELVMRALARNPLDRFASAEAMLTALGRVATSLGGMATPQEIASYVREAVGTELT